VKLSAGACAPIQHHLTLSVTNKAGNKGTHTILVFVGNIC
jgi:hypothetical protein